MKPLPLLLLALLLPLMALADPEHEKLAGHWQYAGATNTCDLTFKDDGTFSVVITKGGEVALTYSGKWFLDKGVIHYTYSKSSAPELVKPGAKDEDKLDGLVTVDYFVIATDKGDHAYTRITDDSKATARLGDDQLQAAVQGVWFSEDVAFQNTGPVHVGGRTQYFPDGTFVADYRVSFAGGARYAREMGEWSISGGKFVETVKEGSDPDNLPPPLTRRITTITATKMVLLSTDRTHAAVQVRGGGELDTGKITVSSLDQKRLLKDLKSVHMSGFNAVPAPETGKNSWVLDSQMVGKPAPEPASTPTPAKPSPAPKPAPAKPTPTPKSTPAKSTPTPKPTPATPTPTPKPTRPK